MNSPGVEFPGRVLRIVSLAVLAMVVCLEGVEVQGQSWSDWERENAISRHGAFMVIRQPSEGFCYVKQSYHDDESKMELFYKGASPTILTPFFSGIDGDVRYWVDDGPERIVQSSEIGRGSSFELAVDVVGEMKAGQVLHIKLRPRREQTRLQSFSLLGFAAAARDLGGPECQAVGSAAVEVKSTNTYTPGAIIYVQSPVILTPFPDEDSLGLEEVKSGLQLLYIQEQNGWLEFRAIGTGGKSGWVPEKTLLEKAPGLVVRSIENEAYRRFVIGFWEYNQTLVRPGFTPFTEVSLLGDGIIKVVATDDWLAQPRPKRNRELDSIFRLWAMADDSGLPIAVYVYDQSGQTRMRQD